MSRYHNGKANGIPPLHTVVVSRNREVKCKIVTSKCPQCGCLVRFPDVRPIQCGHCRTKLCVPRRYFRQASAAASFLTLVAIIGTGGLVWVSPPIFSYLMLWMLAIFVFFIIALLVCVRLRLWISPPSLDYIHANDSVTRLRLGE